MFRRTILNEQTLDNLDINDILARAEGENDSNDTFLSSIKIDSFKEEDDDPNFWLRIIPEDERKNIPEENTKSIKRKKKNNPKEVDKKTKNRR